MLDGSSCHIPNGAVPAVPKLLRSIISHNPNVFSSPPKPKVISTFNCISVSSTEDTVQYECIVVACCKRVRQHDGGLARV